MSSDSADSDKGIRYKTENTRTRNDLYKEHAASAHNRHKSSSHRHKKKHKKERSYSSDDEDEYYRKRRKDKDHRKKHKGESRTKDKLSEEEKSPYKTSNITKVETSNEVNTSFGPALPPHLQQKLEIKKVNTEDDSKNSIVGPALPPHLVNKSSEGNFESISDNDLEKDTLATICGPALPPNLLPQENSREENIISTVGPSLPAHLMQKLSENNINENEQQEEEDIAEISRSVIGPVLPTHLIQKVDENEDEEVPTSPIDSNTDKILGPVLPAHLREKLLEENLQPDEDDETYGPLPPGANFSKSHMELEERALQMKINQLDAPTDNEPSREEWMLELPPAAASFGLGPRTFRTKERPDLSDRSSWTDTPEDKARKKAGKEETKVDVKEEARLKDLQRKDRQQEEIIKKSKRSKESLLDIHTKKLKKKKEDEGPSERRPFSREIDLQVNKFDEAQKKAVLKKAQLLDDRFSAGESKFL